MTYNDSSCGSPGQGSGVGWVKPQFDQEDPGGSGRIQEDATILWQLTPPYVTIL